MDLKELGSRLKAEREQQGLTVEQMMELTKLSRVNVHAIEEGNKDDFPHPVYAKGFIKNYAKALGLDSEEIGNEFSKFYSVDKPGDEEKDINSCVDERLSQNDYSDVSASSSKSSIFIIFLLVVVLASLVYYLNNSSFLNFGESQKKEVLVTDDAIKPVKTDAHNIESLSEKNEDISKVAPAEVSTETPVADFNNKTTAVEDVKIAPESSSKTKAQPVVKNIVVITTKPGEACWLEATSDGISQEYVLQENETVSLSYKKDLKIRFGNAGGVNILSDGNPISLNAAKGKVKTLEFPISE
ncbi:helix-turn-helix domain-containing protein [Desulfovibrio sp. UCD-KL4C]|uniref:helix-turn-helix domain-containing protein n=1 Tax=Desulfovibrio sp. UCD-KL4C TaxID=2578120 RepID=UPI0025C32B8E|nr:helix-turn-helix domain-containing protein [Desulfovibrio sp. UCD-KL4C]